jgi:hypothetical protein
MLYPPELWAHTLYLQQLGVFIGHALFRQWCEKRRGIFRGQLHRLPLAILIEMSAPLDPIQLPAAKLPYRLEISAPHDATTRERVTRNVRRNRPSM